MTRSVLVLGVAHELQSSKFQVYVDDPSYGLLLQSSMHGVDFVFEEALRLSQNRVPARAKVNRSSYSLFENGHGELRKERIPIIWRLIERALLQRAKELRRFPRVENDLLLDLRSLRKLRLLPR